MNPLHLKRKVNKFSWQLIVNNLEFLEIILKKQSLDWKRFLYRNGSMTRA